MKKILKISWHVVIENEVLFSPRGPRFFLINPPFFVLGRLFMFFSNVNIFKISTIFNQEVFDIRFFLGKSWRFDTKKFIID